MSENPILPQGNDIKYLIYYEALGLQLNKSLSVNAISPSIRLVES